MSDGAIMIVLRVVHIISGVFWAGAVMIMAWFVLPTAQAMGPPGGAFMQRLMFGQRLRVFVGGAMGLTILSGLTMYTWLAMETDGAWARSRMGVTLGVGAVAAIIAGGLGGDLGGTATRTFLTMTTPRRDESRGSSIRRRRIAGSPNVGPCVGPVDFGNPAAWCFHQARWLCGPASRRVCLFGLIQLPLR